MPVDFRLNPDLNPYGLHVIEVPYVDQATSHERVEWTSKNLSGRYMDSVKLDKTGKSVSVKYCFTDKEDAFRFKMAWG